MPMDEAALTELREANKPYQAGYERQLAEEIVVMLRNTGADPTRVLAIVDIILNLPVPQRTRESPRPDAA